MIRQQHGGFFVTQLNDGDLAQSPFITFERNTLIQYFWGAESAGQGRQGDAAPRGGRAAPDFSEHLLGAAAQGHEFDSLLLEVSQVSIGGQLGVKDQFGGHASGALLPELDKAQDFVGLLTLGQAGIGVAQNPLGGISGQEDQNALL